MTYNFLSYVPEKVFPDQIGIWLWPQRPVCVRHVGDHDKTYFGFVDNTGKAYVASFNHATNEYIKTFLYDWNTQDDHNQPSLHIRDDGRIIAFIGGHNEPNIYWRISNEPEDISSFGDLKSMATQPNGSGYSYPQPVELKDEGKIYLFYRRFSDSTSSVRGWRFSISEDNGETFIEQPDPLFEDTDVFSTYTTPVGNGKDTIWFSRSDWMTGFQSYVRKDIRVCYYKDGKIYKPDGTEMSDMSNLPVDRLDMERIFDTDQEEKYAFVSDIALDENENPCIAFTSLEKGENESGTYDGNGMNYYHYAHYDGSGWTVDLITEAGGDILSGRTSHPAYNGGLMLNFDDPSEVVMGREQNFKQKDFNIEVWKKDGEWKRKSLIAQSPISSKYFRPYIPRNHHPNLKVIWSGGRYDHYTDFATNIFRSAPFQYRWIETKFN